MCTCMSRQKCLEFTNAHLTNAKMTFQNTRFISERLKVMDDTIATLNSGFIDKAPPNWNIVEWTFEIVLVCNAQNRMRDGKQMHPKNRMWQRQLLVLYGSMHTFSLFCYNERAPECMYR